MARQNPAKRPVLIVDDDRAVLLNVRMALESGAIGNLTTCDDSREVLTILSRQEIDLLLLDLNMPHRSGTDLLPEIREQYPDLPVIIVTGSTEVGLAVDCMKLGVFDYLVKPIERSKLLATVGRALEIRELRRENTSLKSRLIDGKLDHPEAFGPIVFRDEKMRSVLMYVESIAESRQTVLITGETGVGKELIATAIHALSGRKGPLVTVNVAGYDESMFSDALFGHLRGAYTGADKDRSGLIERSEGGTLFLDEIGDLKPESQVKLLRLLESREYYPLGSDAPRRTDARIVVATNRDLQRSVDDGAFRKDLYFRLET
ncbi:MAG TPA: sigma-54 dependent transcriptional regulator, partial [Spirochaetia bacterium]|nr:sigma-54 dependent transcriptional regulator [Spirochaetia bacterium]